MPIALVTGGAKGIGAVISRRLLADGYDVVAMSRSRPEGFDLPFVAGDVTEPGAHAAAFAEAERLHPGGQVTCLVCNAGVFGNEREHVEDVDMRTFDKVMAVNLRGVVLGMREFAEHQRGRGAPANVVVIKSIYGSAVSQLGNAAYFASKHAVRGVVSFAAVDLARPRADMPRIRVNSVSPGFTPSNMTQGWLRDKRDEVADLHPAGRWTDAEDVAHAVSYLASDRAGSVTGEDLFVDHGVHVESVPSRGIVDRFVSSAKRGGGSAPTVLVWCMSNNRASKNRGLARMALKWFKKNGVAAEEIDPERDVDVLPPYRQHEEEAAMADPESAVSRLRDRVARCQALLIFTPTYNASIPGVAKNAIDWLSRGCCPSDPRAQSVLIGKVIAHGGVGWGLDGTKQTRHRTLEPILRYACHPGLYYPVPEPLRESLAVGQDREQFDDKGSLTGDSRKKWKKRVGALCQRLVEANEMYRPLIERAGKKTGR